jgi:hypothetical protein
MAAFVEFLDRLLSHGAVTLRERPHVAETEMPEANRLLEQAYDQHRLEVAGPPLEFDVACARQAGMQVWFSCWFLVQREEPAEVLEACLPIPGTPQTPAEHLSGDLLYRFLPQVHRRARALDRQDRLTLRLEEILRAWPLSGVLADLTEGPLASVELGGHPGLLLLYAERLALQPREAWLPAEKGREYVDWVFAERGLRVP